MESLKNSPLILLVRNSNSTYCLHMGKSVQMVMYEHGLGICGYELIRELFIFIKLIFNSYLKQNYL